jgi:cytochrome bd-type quinol oxidase subunit 2
MLCEGARRFLQESIAMPLTFALLAPFAIAVAACMLSLGFFLGTCWAAIHTSDEPAQRGADYARTDRPLLARDPRIDRFDYVEHG